MFDSFIEPTPAQRKRQLFARGPIRTPLCLRGDAYTVASSRIVSPEARQRSVYNFTNRRSPAVAWPTVAKDSRMVLYGLNDFIRNELTTRDTPIEVLLAFKFLESAHSFGGKLDFDYKMWDRIATHRKGWLPIRIKGLPEGSTFWPNEPVIQVESLERGFGEVAATIEALLVGYVSCGTARATLTRHLLERVRERVRKHNPTYNAERVDAIAQWMVHDFGMRASSCQQESAMYGRAHLLSFNGTDTFNAAYQAWHENAARPTGTSILALAHRIVMGFATEQEAYEAIYHATQDSTTPIGSYVADCYDFHNAVRTFLVEIAKRGSEVVVARPDSGDYLENILFIVDEAMKAGLHRPDEQGRPIATSLRFIQGDSMTWEKMETVFDNLDKAGVNPTQWGIFGVGGWLRNSVNRDSLSSAYKLSAAGLENHPKVKLSDTPDKMSVPGPNIVVRGETHVIRDGPTVLFEKDWRDSFGEEYGVENRYVTYYDGSLQSEEAFTEYCYEDFDIHRNRALCEFDSYANMPANYGTRDCSPLSLAIKDCQEAVLRQNGR